MAEVFLARQIGAEGFERFVALKRMASSLSHDERFARMFIAEARVAAALAHPNIISIVDFDRDEDGRLFLAMEYVDGSDLRRLCDVAGAHGLPPAVVAYVLAEVLEALAYAHERPSTETTGPVVHRDVSPHNVLLARNGAVKLADFGIAKAQAAFSQSHSGTIKGKLAYMAPEQARGQVLDGRADVFSVGVMGYELLCGHRPFDGPTEAAILARLLAHRHVPLAEAAPNAPRSLTDAIEQMMASPREMRFPSARAALDALRGDPIFPRDGRDLVASMVERAGPVAPKPLGGGVPLEVTGARATPTGPPEGRKPTRALLLWLGAVAGLSVAAAAAVWLVPGLAPRSAAEGAGPTAETAETGAAPDPAATRAEEAATSQTFEAIEPAPQGEDEVRPVPPRPAVRTSDVRPAPAPRPGSAGSEAPDAGTPRRTERRKVPWEVPVRGRAPDDLTIDD